MFDQFIPFINKQYKALNILIVEPSKFYTAFLENAIACSRPYHNIMTLDKIEDVFSLMYEEVQIDAIVFDLDSMSELDNIAIVNAISPEIAFMHWSHCQHPEIIELIHQLGVNSFCLKDSNASTLIAAIDSIATNRHILYIDERLNQCLPLLAS